jgi:hypothetical protein
LVKGGRRDPGGSFALDIAKIKALLRKAAVRTVKVLDAAIAAALDVFIPDECANYFANSGYEPN